MLQVWLLRFGSWTPKNLYLKTLSTEGFACLGLLEIHPRWKLPVFSNPAIPHRIHGTIVYLPTISHKKSTKCSKNIPVPWILRVLPGSDPELSKQESLDEKGQHSPTNSTDLPSPTPGKCIPYQSDIFCLI